VNAPASIPTTEYVYAVIRRGGDVLVVHRDNESGRIPAFHLPGGRLDFGEHASSELLRFVTEQTGASVTSCTRIGRDDQVVSSLGTSSDRVTWFFACEIAADPAIAASSSWQSLEQFRDDDALLFPDEALALLDTLD
jgi:ADP-ribose pyrophosphatase YjhB (NUDIX family)